MGFVRPVHHGHPGGADHPVWPEVDLFLTKVKPVMQKIAKAVARGDRHRTNGQPFSTAMEYRNALGLDREKCAPCTAWG